MGASDHSHVLRLAELPERKPTRFALAPDSAELSEIAGELSLLGLRKLRFAGTLTPVAGRDWRLEADLGATVVQPCAVTNAPVSTRIEEAVTRSYSAAMEMPEGGGEVEMPEDDSIEPLPATIDLRAVMTEALALALPLYPRAEDAEMTPIRATPPGADPLDDEAVKPFAGLAGLRDKLAGGSEEPN